MTLAHNWLRDCRTVWLRIGVRHDKSPGHIPVSERNVHIKVTVLALGWKTQTHEGLKSGALRICPPISVQSCVLHPRAQCVRHVQPVGAARPCNSCWED